MSKGAIIGEFLPLSTVSELLEWSPVTAGVEDLIGHEIYVAYEPLAQVRKNIGFDESRLFELIFDGEWYCAAE